MRGWFCLLAILTVILIPAHYYGPVAQTQQRVVKVGVYQNRPKVFVGPGGEGGGFFMDILSDVAKREGWTLQQIPCDWADCLAGLSDGRLDLMPDVAWSIERSNRFDFNPTPVIESWSQMYAAPGQRLESVGDLQGHKVAILEGSIQLDSLRQLVSGLGIKVQFVTTHSIDEAFAAVKSGRADVAVSNHFFGDYFYRSYGLTKTAVVFQPASVHFATGKGMNGDLLAAIEEHVRGQRTDANSKYYESLRNWMAGSVSTDETPGWVYWLVGAFVGLLLVSAAVTLLLRGQIRAKTAHLARANEDLQKAQHELQKSGQLLAATQEIAGVGGWEWDVRSGMLMWTDQTFAIHGIEKDQPERPAVDLFDRSIAMFEPGNREGVTECCRRCVFEGVPFDIESMFTNEKGRQLRVLISGRPVRDGGGGIVGIVGTMMDVTQIRADQDARIRAEEELRVARRMETVGHLTGGIAHDFNNLLSAILGYTGLMLRRSELTEQMRNDLGQIQKAGERAANLTHQLLAFGSKRMLQPRVVSMNSVVTGLEKMLGRVLAENITTDVRLSASAGNVLIDPGQMEQVIINLAVNARDAMPDGGTLVIETSPLELNAPSQFSGVAVGPGRWVVLSVSDTGSGMDAQTKSRIFEPFFTTKEVGHGTGLGLATVFDIVTMGGGHVAVDSEPGEGSTFRVFLPALDAPAMETCTRADELVPGTGTVLVVEDDDEVRTVAERILAAAGYRVLTAVDGADAVAMCQRHSNEIDLVLADMVLPRVEGRGLASTLAARFPDIRFVFMSGHADFGLEGSSGVDFGRNFVSKPFTASDLTAKIHEVLSSAR